MLIRFDKDSYVCIFTFSLIETLTNALISSGVGGSAELLQNNDASEEAVTSSIFRNY